MITLSLILTARRLIFQPLASRKVGPQKRLANQTQPPAYALTDFEGGNPVGECLPYPIQVAREYSLPSTNEDPILQTNAAAHELIRQANPDSVYQYISAN